MDAGELDQQILIQARTVSTDSYGQQIESWSTDSEPWARVIETPGREFLKAGDIQAEGKAVFVIRWRSGLDSTARVTWRGRVYTVEDITGTQRDGYIWLHTKSVAGAN